MCADPTCDTCRWLDKATVKRVFCAVHGRELTETGSCLACQADYPDAEASHPEH